MRDLAGNLKKAVEVAKALEGAIGMLDKILKTGAVLLR